MRDMLLYLRNFRVNQYYSTITPSVQTVNQCPVKKQKDIAYRLRLKFMSVHIQKSSDCPKAELLSTAMSKWRNLNRTSASWIQVRVFQVKGRGLRDACVNATSFNLFQGEFSNVNIKKKCFSSTEWVDQFIRGT